MIRDRLLQVYPAKPPYADRAALDRKLYAEQQTPVDQLCQMFRVSRSAFYRYVPQRDPRDRAS